MFLVAAVLLTHYLSISQYWSSDTGNVSNMTKQTSNSRRVLLYSAELTLTCNSPVSKLHEAEPSYLFIVINKFGLLHHSLQLLESL